MDSGLGWSLESIHAIIDSSTMYRWVVVMVAANDKTIAECDR